MTEPDFQNMVLQMLQQQARFNERVEKFMERTEQFMEDQKETNQKLTVDYDGLVFLVEEQVVRRLDGISDGTKLYTDQKVRKHEETYRHVPAVA